MPLQIQSMKEEDLTVYPDLIWNAFKDDLMAVLYPNGYSKADKEGTTKRSLAGWRRHPDTIKWMKVVDTDLPSDHPLAQVVGVSRWAFYPQERTEEELDAEAQEGQNDESEPGLNEAFAEVFFGTCKRLRREIMGRKAYILLHMLATHPSYHRRGVGGMHLSWGSEHADKLGLPMYLEASPMGRPLYERHGYEKVADLPFPGREFGLKKDLPHVCMVRPAQEANGKAV